MNQIITNRKFTFERCFHQIFGGRSSNDLDFLSCGIEISTKKQEICDFDSFQSKFGDIPNKRNILPQ